MKINFKVIKNYLYELYPPESSFQWDSDGVEVCFDEDEIADKILLCLDITADIINFAAQNKYNCIISHHPLLFSPVKKLNSYDSSEIKNAMTMLKNNINAMSFHTRLDSADGGVNDAFIKAVKLDADSVSVVKFGNKDNDSIGRIAELREETNITDFARKIKENLAAYLKFHNFNNKFPVQYVRGDRPIKKVAVVAGGGIMFINEAVADGADTFVSGEAGYNKLVSAYDINSGKSRLNFVMFNHFESEVVVLPVLKRILEDKFADFGLTVDIYTNNRIESL